MSKRTLDEAGIVTQETEWVKAFSRTHQCDYWFNTTTQESVWEDPNARPSRDSNPQSHSNESGATSEVAVDPEVILEEERSRLVVPNSSECPRLIDALDVASLVVRIRQENAGVASGGSDKAYSTIFSLENDETAMITRAVQEDEILKTRLKLYRKNKPLLDLPSFWEVWCKPDGNVRLC